MSGVVGELAEWTGERGDRVRPPEERISGSVSRLMVEFRISSLGRKLLLGVGICKAARPFVPESD